MVEIIEVDRCLVQNTVGYVSVKSLEHLKKIAKTLKEPFIFKTGKEEYTFFHQCVCYRYKE